MEDRTIKTQTIYNLEASRIGLGAMRYAAKGTQHIQELIEAAHALGYNFFDHADIYGDGQAEQVFGDALKASSVKREDIILQSKAGIQYRAYNFDPQHLVTQIEQSLKKLGTDYLDIFLLHRPDTLMEPELIAEAFDKLESQGKVRHFGVSNFNPMQIEMLQSVVKQEPTLARGLAGDGERRHQ